MCFFQSKYKKHQKQFEKHDETIKENVENLRLNLAKVRTLIAMSDSEVVKEKLHEVEGLLEYGSPSASPAVVKEDEKIYNKLDDIKILISGDKNEAKILDKINDVRIMIVERNSLSGV